MQQMAKGPDRRGMAHHGAKATILSILDVTQPIAVLDDGLPTREVAHPRADVIVHPNVAAEHVTTPAVVVARHPENGDVSIDHVRERGENSKRRPRDHGSPLEPELEEIAVDYERACAAAQMAQERQHLPLDVAWDGAKMRVGKHVARTREHAHSLLRSRSLYKRSRSTHFRARCSSIGATAPMAHSPVVRRTDGTERTWPDRDERTRRCNRGGRRDGQGGQRSARW